MLAEGFREENHPKLLVYRAASGKPLPDPARIPGLLAVVTDQPIDGPFPVLDIDDAASVITFALHALNLTGQPTA